MTFIQWDQAGEHRYESGTDRGVLYTPWGNVVPWNGLIGVTEKTTGNEQTSLYFDGVKFGDAMSPGDFAATLRAYTYPDEFMEIEGIGYAGNGLFIGNQFPSRFGLSYRTKIGTDEDPDQGYKIHVLYNLLAVPSEKAHKTISGVDAMEFQWEITAVPADVPGFRATAHLIFDTRYMDPLFLIDIERTLYGDEFNFPKLPLIEALVKYSSNWVIIRIIDNLDGTWTAEGPDELITMLDATTFQITQANAKFLDDELTTYMISDLTH